MNVNQTNCAVKSQASKPHTASVFQIQRFCLHDGPGIRTSVFFKGCPLYCKWCANPECHITPDRQQSSVRQYTVSELVSEVSRDLPFFLKSGGGVTLTGGEVLLWADFALELCTNLHNLGISVAIETSGYAPSEKFLALASAVDLVIIDAKHHDPKRHLDGTGGDCAVIYKNISLLIKHGIPHVVRIPIIPGYNDDTLDAHAFGKHLSYLGAERVQLLPFHQLGEQKYTEFNIDYAYSGVSQLHNEDLTQYASVLQQYIPNVTIGGSL